MGGCSVAFCHNRFVRGTKHFFRFPKDWRRAIWIKFTLRKNNFMPKNSSTICEDHFMPELIQKKKDRVSLNKEAVPTIFTREGERFDIRFDSTKREYEDEDFEPLRLPSTSSSSHQPETEESILQQKQVLLDDLKEGCRFCFSTENNKVPISKLEDYSINQFELMTQLEIEAQLDELFSEFFLCEQCFQQIVAIDVFRKKVKKAQLDVLAEIQELDARIIEMRGPTKFEIISMDSTIEIIEEHLIDEEFIEEEVEYIEETVEDYNDMSMLENGENVQDEEIYESQCELSNEKFTVQGVDEYEQVTTDDIIKNPDRNRFCFKIYECFFCKMKFAGRKTYIAHKCSVAEIKCEKCDKTFNKLQGYNSHLTHVHSALPTQKHSCPICKTVIVATVNQFKAHRRSCNKKSQNQQIECEICQKVCNSLKGYTIHKLFHETRNYTTSKGEKIASAGLNVFRGTAVCELCGKEFQSQSGYRMHRRNVHKVGYEGEIFQCQLCPKTCPTRRSLFDHMRNTHRVQETPCNVCGKVFRTKILLSKHMMYHDESKRVWFCDLCPDKPGYFTNVALKRHQKSHLGKRDYHCGECGAAYTTNHQLKVHSSNKHGIVM